MREIGPTCLYEIEQISTSTVKRQRGCWSCGESERQRPRAVVNNVCAHITCVCVCVCSVGWRADIKRWLWSRPSGLTASLAESRTATALPRNPRVLC
jgi:hypothetical protein